MACAVIILLGGASALLLALSIALSAVKFLPGMPAPATNPASLFTHLPDTPGSAKIRRTILLPPEQDDEAPGERAGAIGNIGRRLTGLLARYGQSQQQ